MRAFLILCCVATAYATSVGYDYERNSGSLGGQDGGPSGGGGLLSGGLDGLGGGSQGGQGGQEGGPAYGGQSDLGGPGAAGGPAEFSKEFFTFSAPESEFNDDVGHNQLSDSLKKSLRVIFIKGPENSGLEKAALQLAKSASDDRTAIYVLNKQADISELANKLQTLKSNANNKPEVHFVKYRTPADAENAQHAIQSQYNSLGGPSSSHNGGVAPVLNFASKAPAPVAHHGGSSNAYLPPNRRF